MPPLSRLLALFLLMALVATSALAAGAADTDSSCDEWDSATQTAANCDVTGDAIQIGQNNFEPTMGVTPAGGLYMATTPARGVAVGWKAGVAKAANLEDAFTGPSGWSDVQPKIAGYSNPPETNDPYAYVDPTTGRIFSFHMSPILLCSILSYSDDEGATWTTPPVGCGPSGAWDHQTMVAAPPTPGTITIGYPNVLVQCVNSVYAEMCARSLDGGLTWGSGYPAYENENLSRLCGTQTGHLASDDEGNFYLPTPVCGDRASMYVSTDSGLTWTERVINDQAMPFTDPAIDFDADGNLHATWINSAHRVMYAVSADKGISWTDPVTVTSPDVFAVLPALVAGDAGNVAIAYGATTDLLPGKGFDTKHLPNANKVAWGAYMSVSTDATAEGAPTFVTVNTTGDDPIQRGTSCSSRCLYLVDFIDVVITPDGAAVAAFSDGCDNEACIAGDSGNNVTDRGKGMVTTVDVDLCADVCHQFAPAAAPAPIALGAAPQVHSPFVLRDHIGDAGYQALLNQHRVSLGL